MARHPQRGAAQSASAPALDTSPSFGRFNPDDILDAFEPFDPDDEPLPDEGDFWWERDEDLPG